MKKRTNYVKNSNSKKCNKNNLLNNIDFNIDLQGVRNNFGGITKNKTVIITSASVLAITVLGFNVLGSSSFRLKNADSTEFIPYPQQKFSGVSEAGYEYADSARKVMKKLNSYDFYNDGEKVVYLTFDDGPSSSNTEKILDILEKEEVRATFFVTGSTIEKNKSKSSELLKRSYEYGNSIGNHSYSHDYNYLYPSNTLNLDNFLADINKTNELLNDILGDDFSTNIVRCPGGSMSWKNIDELYTYLDKNSMASINWNALNGDATGKKKNASELVDETIKTSKDKDMVVLLMHDSSGKDETVKALPEIIKYFKSNGYEFRTLV